MFATGDAKSSEEMQAEVNQLKMEAEERKKEVDDLQSALEKKRLEAEEKMSEAQERSKAVEELQAALDERKRELEERDRQMEETRGDLQEVNKLLEEKSREADESMEKYCSLMVKVHKLEETNDALTTRLEQITASEQAKDANIHPSSTDNTTCRRSGRRSSSRQQQEVKSDNSENTAPSTPRSSLQGSSAGKRGHHDISDKDSAQEALHNLTKKIRENAAGMTTPKPGREQEEDEFRPEGLPELVQRGMYGAGIQRSHSSITSSSRSR